MIGRLVAALVLAGAAVAAPEGRRMLGDDEAGDWQAVGRLNVAGRSFCTAVLVGPETVLTAAHCLVHPVTRSVARPDSIHFVAGYRLGQFAAHRQAEAVMLAPGFDPARSAARQDLRADTAFLRLDAPIRDVTPIEIGRPVRPGEAVTVVSYARDRPEAASVDDGCTVAELRAGLARLDCPALHGMSGAAVLTRAEGAFRVGAVIVATLGEGGGGSALAAIPLGETAAAGDRRAP